MPRPLYTLHPRPLTTLYGDLENHAAAQAELLLGTPGSLLERQNAAGFRFYARQFYDGEGNKREQYVAGPVGDAAADVAAEQVRARIADANEALRDARLLGREGFQLVDARAFVTLASLHNHGLFRAGAVLVGSHALGALLNRMGVRAAAYSTEDVDLARGQALAFSKRPDASLLDMLRDSGLAFVPVPAMDVRDAPTSWKQKGRGRFHVDLLVPSPDRSFPIVPVPELKAHATGLPYLRYLLGQTQTSIVLSRMGCCLVRLPTPERFAVHKLVVSQLRVGHDAKSEKDRYQAAVVVAALAEGHPGALDSAIDDLPAGARRYLAAAIAQVRPHLAPPHPRAWAALNGE